MSEHTNPGYTIHHAELRHEDLGTFLNYLVAGESGAMLTISILIDSENMTPKSVNETGALLDELVPITSEAIAMAREAQLAADPCNPNRTGW